MSDIDRAMQMLTAWMDNTHRGYWGMGSHINGEFTVTLFIDKPYSKLSYVKGKATRATLPDAIRAALSQAVDSIDNVAAYNAALSRPEDDAILYGDTPANKEGNE